MHAGAQQVRIGRPDPESADGETAAERFCHRNSVRQKIVFAQSSVVGADVLENPLETLEAPSAEMPALHPVHEQQQFLFIA